ncbi:MAG: ABC transporter ATP-binding protein, partial [Pseudomonadota bacterium]
EGPVHAVRGIDLDVAKGETLGLVGESGSGKSVTAFSILKILDQGGALAADEMTYDGLDLAAAGEANMNDLRGREISMIFQNPRAALNPIRKVGHQIEDVLRRHAQASWQDARAKAISALDEVKIADAEARYEAYPFELSGGMCQRVVIAMALACRPKLLIADEPTTGLDVTTQKAVMDLVRQLSEARQMSVILITHDLGLAGEYCDRLIVMKDGQLVETGAPVALAEAADHPYTRRLVAATPSPGKDLHDLIEADAPPPSPVISNDSLLRVDALEMTYAGKSGPVHALQGISFDIKRGASLGLVGESGSGKSTASAIIARLIDPTGGAVHFDGAPLTDVPAKAFAADPRRPLIQMVFQDATDSLNPRHTALQAIAEPLKRLTTLGRSEREARVRELADQVGLPQTLLGRLPHQLSGGQKARVGIARALALRPKLLILDEPTAALDVSIQALVLNLLAQLRADLGLTYLFISHDLAVVKLLCEDVVVLRQGQIEEAGPAAELLSAPRSDYARRLIDAVPRPLRVPS